VENEAHIVVNHASLGLLVLGVREGSEENAGEGSDQGQKFHFLRNGRGEILSPRIERRSGNLLEDARDRALGFLPNRFESEEVNASEVIERLELEPLEGEGGYFRRTFESEEKVGHRACGTAIYYLVTPQSFSTLHRLPQSELFHFYLGDPVEMIQINRGVLTRVILGTAVIGGMLAASLLAIFLIPVSFYIVEKLSGRSPVQQVASASPHVAVGDLPLKT